MNLPENKSEDRLNNALRVLASGTQGGPPETLGEVLTRAFRDHHANRRLVRQMAIVAGVVAVILPSLWLLKRNDSIGTKGFKAHNASRIESQDTSSVRESESFAAITHPPTTRHTVKRTETSPIHRPVEFIALPAYSASARTSDARIVRLQLSGRALRMVGAPISTEDDNRRLLADFVVGQDGTPYAVRLVH